MFLIVNEEFYHQLVGGAAAVEGCWAVCTATHVMQTRCQLV